MDRKQYLAPLYSEADRKLIKVFHDEMQRLNLLYLRAINAKDLSKARELLEKIKNISKTLKSQYWERADYAIPKEYMKGSAYINDIVDKTNSLSLIESASQKEIFWMIKWLWPIHVEAVNALLNTSKNYVQSSLDWMERQAISMIWELQQQKIREQLAWSMISWDSLQNMKQRVENYFLNNQITWFKDRSWRIWSMDRYVDMLTRTETAIANVQGTINRAIQVWITQFKVVEQPDCCEICKDYTWKVVDLKDWVANLPPYHPNCRGYIIAQI